MSDMSLTDEEIRTSFVAACRGVRNDDEMIGSRGVAKAQLKKAEPLIRRKTIQDVIDWLEGDIKKIVERREANPSAGTTYQVFSGAEQASLQTTVNELKRFLKEGGEIPGGIRQDERKQIAEDLVELGLLVEAGDNLLFADTQGWREALEKLRKGEALRGEK